MWYLLKHIYTFDKGPDVLKIPAIANAGMQSVEVREIHQPTTLAHIG